MLRLIRKLKKGFSIVEVVIAIAVISIISVSAVSTLTYAIKVQNKNLRDYDLATTCNTVIDYFWLDKDINDTFWQHIINDDCGYKVIEENGIKKIDRKSYKLSITLANNKLTLTAIDNNDNEFYKISYETQGGA